MAPGLDLGLGLAVGCGRGALTGLGGCLAAVLGFGWVAGVGLVGAWALAAAGLLAVGAGLGARLGGVPRGLGGGVLDEAWWWLWMRWSWWWRLWSRWRKKGCGRQRRVLGFGGGRMMQGKSTGRR